jgi:hypothetical protein
MRSFAVVFAVCFSLGCGLGCRDGSRPANPEAEAKAAVESLAVDVVPACDPTKVATRLAMTDTATAARILCQWYAGLHSYKLVGFRKGGDTPHPIMRRLIVDAPTGAMFVAFDEITFAYEKGKLVGIGDVFSFRQGVWISELIAANATGSAGPTDFLGPSSKHPEVLAAQDTLRSGDRAAALAAIDALPAAVRKERGVQMLRVRSAAGLSADQYKQALTEIAQTFPDDPAIALISIDGALDVDDFDRAIQWIDTLEKTIGVDAYLESTRTVALIRKGDLDKALAAADAAVTLEPTLTRALEIKLDVLIAKKQWDQVLAVMTELETHHGTRFDVAKLRAQPHLAELVQSPAFATWLEQRTK